MLSVLDSVSMIVGIVIGTGIFVLPGLVAANVGSSGSLLACWVAGGVVSMMGAVCYAELIARFPRDGGDYQFLKECYGPHAGFVFAWTQFWVVRPGTIASMAYIFGQNARNLFTPETDISAATYWAIGLITVITLLNLLGIRTGKNLQNMLTFLKVAGLVTVFVAAFTVPLAPSSQTTASVPFANLGQAMIFVMFAFGGWTDIAFVGAEVKDPERKAFPVMALGVLALTLIYLAMNAAYLWALGFDGVRGKMTAASDTAGAAMGAWGARFVIALILVATAGALNGVVLTGSRIYYAFGQDHKFFSWLGRWNPRLGTPTNSLIVQGLLTCGLTWLVSSEFWHRLFATAADAKYNPDDALNRLVNYTTPAYWFFVALAVLSIYFFRLKQRGEVGGIRPPGYPVTPALFAAVCGALIYSSLDYAINQGVYEAVWSAGFVVVGVIVALITVRRPAAAAK